MKSLNNQNPPIDYHLTLGMAKELGIAGEDGSAWLVAKDVCDILGYANPTMAVSQHCKHPELLKANESLLLDCLT